MNSINELNTVLSCFRYTSLVKQKNTNILLVIPRRITQHMCICSERNRSDMNVWSKTLCFASFCFSLISSAIHCKLNKLFKANKSWFCKKKNKKKRKRGKTRDISQLQQEVKTCKKKNEKHNLEYAA